MYQPAHGKFKVADAPALLERLAASVPATLVTTAADGFLTSILPMIFDSSDGPNGVLRGHLARPNPQWQAASGTAAIAVFNGPDAYISPAWYEEKRLTGRVVPTWNYTTVVAHGRLVVHDDVDWLVAHVRQLVERHEADRSEPWSVDDAPAGYIYGQARGIVGLELRVVRIEAKRKLIQNRSAADIYGTLEGLEAGTPRERAVAEDMRRDE